MGGATVSTAAFEATIFERTVDMIRTAEIIDALTMFLFWIFLRIFMLL